MTWNGKGLMQGCSAKLNRRDLQAAPILPQYMQTWEMFHWHNQVVCSPPPPPICGGTAQSHGWGVSRTYIIFLTRHIRSLCRDKNKSSEEKHFWSKLKVKYRSVQSSECRAQKGQESGEGWGRGEWKAPNPEADENQEPAGWEGQRRSRPGPRDDFKVTCKRPSLPSFPTGWPLQQIPCHILSTSLFRHLLPTDHSLQQFACQGFQFPFPLRLLLLSLLMCGLGQHSCIFPSHFLPLFVAFSHKGWPGVLCPLHDPSRFRCFLSSWEYYQNKIWETLLCKVILVSISQGSSLFWFFFLCSYRLQLPLKRSILVPACAKWGHFYRLPALLCNPSLFWVNNVKNLIHNLTTITGGKPGAFWAFSKWFKYPCTASYFDDSPISWLVTISMKHTSFSTHPACPGCTWVFPWQGNHIWVWSQVLPHLPASLVLATRDVMAQRMGGGFHVLITPPRGDKSDLSLLECAKFQWLCTLHVLF